jgi:4-oxalocrotonate tautomerase
MACVLPPRKVTQVSAAPAARRACRAFGPGGYARGSVVPIVTVQQSPRPLAQKRALVAAITEAFVQAYGVTPEQVQVFIQEVDDENWAKAGNLAADRPPHR